MRRFKEFRNRNILRNLKVNKGTQEKSSKFSCRRMYSILFTIIILCTMYCVLLTGETFAFDKEALLDKVKETSLVKDIRWTENKGQLSLGKSSEEKDFYDTIKYYTRTPWGYFLIKDDNAVILNFIKPIKYTKGNIIVLVEQPDWEETARKELDLPSNKIAQLRRDGFIKHRRKKIYLESEYREKKSNLLPNEDNRKKHGDLLEEFKTSYHSYNLELSVNGKKPVRIEPQGEREEKQSFFKGRDSSKWVRGLTTYNEMWAYFEEGVIFRFYPKTKERNQKTPACRQAGVTSNQKIEKEVIIPQGTKLEDVYLTYASDEEFGLKVRDMGVGQGIQGNEGSELVIGFDGYEFSEQVPFAYVIDENNERKEVKANYVLLPTTYNLSPIAYHFSPVNKEHRHFLKVCQIESEWNGDGTFIFDPLIAATYVAGSGEDYGRSGIVLDSSGNVYVACYTESTDFPTTGGAYDETEGGSYDIAISKLNSNLTSLLASTYLGGSGYEEVGYDIAIDISDDVYVAGWSNSTDFPTTSGAYDETGNSNGDWIISKFNSALNDLVASTCLGGTWGDEAMSIALDSLWVVYVVGETYNSYDHSFPVTSGAFDETGSGSGSNYDIAIAKLTPDLTTVLAATYLCGDVKADVDLARHISLDDSDNVYVTLVTPATDFPVTSGAYDETGDSGSYDIVISKLNSSLTTLLASTYLGGTDGYEYIYDLAFDSAGNVYGSGITRSTDFPVTSGAYDETGGSGDDMVVCKFNSDFSSLLASTYIGGTSDTSSAQGITLDPAGNVFICGFCRATTFPTTSGAYDETGDGDEVDFDLAVCKLNSDLSDILISTRVGGPSNDYGQARMILDSFNNVYVYGWTRDSDAVGFPTTPGAYDETGNTASNDGDLIIIKLSPDLSCLEYTGGSGGGDSSDKMTADEAVGYETPAAQLGFTTSPSNSNAGVVFSVQPVVAVQDQYGNTILTANDNVTVAISNNPNNGTLSGTDTVAADTGEATFSGLSIDEPGVGYTLEATSGGLTPGTSNSFDIGGPPWVSAISGSQLTDGTKRVQITYTACDIESENCNLTTAATQAQYSDDNSTWYDATLSGTTTGITTTPGGTQHSDLYWEAGTDLDNTEDSTVYFRVKLNDGTATGVSYDGSSAFLLDTKAPVISSATVVSSSPVAGDTTLSLNSVWTDANYASATSTFYCALDGETYDGGTAGSTATLSPSGTISLGATLNGHSYFSRIKSTLTDDYGNTSSESEDTTDVGVKPYTPSLLTLSNPTSTTVDVTVVRNTLEATGLEYAIYISPAVGGDNYIQANGSVGASEVWQTIADWGTTKVTGLTPGTTYTLQAKSRSYHLTSIESDFSTGRNTEVLITKTLYVDYEYISTTQLEFLVWFEEEGQVVTSGLSGTATVNLYNSDGSSISVTGNTDATADSQGVYSVTPTRSAGTFTENTTYYAVVSLPYDVKTYTKTYAFKIETDDTGNISAILTDTETTLPSTISTIEGKVDVIDAAIDSVLTDTGTTLPATISTIGGKADDVDTVVDSILTDTGTTLPGTITTAEGKVDTVDGIVDDILLDTGTDLSSDITAAKTDIITELAKGLKARILNRPTEAATGESLTIRYKTSSGLGPVIDVYDANNSKRIAGAVMTEIGTTGVYEYDLTLSSTWGTGDFTIICSEATSSSVDSMVLEVSSSSSTSDLSTIESKVDVLDTNVDSLVTNIASIKSTAEDTNSDLATVQSSVSSIITKWGSYTASDLLSDTDDLSAYIGTPDDASGEDTVFGRLAQVYDSTGTISSASTYAQSAYDEIQSLRREVNFNGKTDTAYELLVSLGGTLSNLQASVAGLTGEASEGRIEEIYSSINANISALKGLIAAEGQEVVTTETEPKEEVVGITELSNQLKELKTLLGVAKNLMEKEREEPVVETWFEMK